MTLWLLALVALVALLVLLALRDLFQREHTAGGTSR